MKAVLVMTEMRGSKPGHSCRRAPRWPRALSGQSGAYKELKTFQHAFEDHVHKQCARRHDAGQLDHTKSAQWPSVHNRLTLTCCSLSYRMN